MITIPLEPVLVWMLVFLRVGFVLAFLPLIGERFVPARVRVMMALVIALALAPVAPVTAAHFPLTIGAMAWLVLTEAMLGFSVGFIGRVMMAVVQFSGQVAGEQMGFGLINTIDPTGSNQISVIAELQYLMAIMVFLALDLHLSFLAAAAASFHTLPPGSAVVGAGLTAMMMDLGRTLYSLSLSLAMPVILIVFSINVGLGMIARAVPQMNIFLESFPLRILAGISILLLSLGFTVTIWEQMFAGLDGMLARTLDLMSNGQ